MSTNNLLPIANEGWKYIGCAIVIFLFLGFIDFDFLQFFAFLSILFFLFVFRNPEREIVNFEDSAVVSPVDGIISSIEELKDANDGYKVEIDSSYFNVSLLRVPLTSKVKNIKIMKGARLSKFTKLSAVLNERAEITFEDNDSNSLKVIHTLKQSFKSIDIKLINSQKVNQSYRYGLMVNGITTLILPKNFRLNLSVGQEIKASQSLVGYFTS